MVLGGFAVGAAGCFPAVPQPPPTLFPNDTLTVADLAQATGKRMNLPLPDCTDRPSDCDEINLVNQLDGFDLDPTIEIGFAGPIDVAKVTDTSVYVQPSAGGSTIGLNRLVWDPATNTLYGHAKHQLAEATEFQLVVTDAVNGQAGTSTFTTMSATVGLRKMREQLGSGQAYTDASIADRKLRIDNDSASQPAAYLSATVAPIVGLERTNDLGSSTATEQTFDSTVQATGNSGTYVFGSFDAPQWLDATARTIPTPPTGGAGPPAVRSETIGFVAVTPGAATCPTGPPTGGWPVAIFGPGVTRSKYDVLLASDENLRNCIATIAIDPVGHAYGPNSFVTITKFPVPTTVTVTSHGRGRDVNGDGAIGGREGVQTKGQPDANASIGLRDGLRQTALDNMSLVRALQADYGAGSGFAIPGAGTRAPQPGAVAV